MTDRLVVCRCEDVTARDVYHAVEQGYRDIESLKRFTGLGTGICQGVHCLALALRMAEEAAAKSPSSHDEALATPFTPRPPLEPTPLAWLAALPLPEASDGPRERTGHTLEPTSTPPSPTSSTGRPTSQSTATSEQAPSNKPTQGE